MSYSRIPPVIKWTGSKGTRMPHISTLFPEGYARFFDPFVGGGSSLPYSLATGVTICGDIIPELIDLWTLIATAPQTVKVSYRDNWGRQQADNNWYYTVRDEFNRSRDPLLFLFLTRTCYSGLIRFNGKGEFNVSHHFGRAGIHPDTFDGIVDLWHETVSNMQFYCRPYTDTLQLATAGDFVFLDPPYVGTNGQYQVGASTFDYTSFYATLGELNDRGVMWLLTLGNDDANCVPTDLYRYTTVNAPQSSSLARIKNQIGRYSADQIYCNYIPPQAQKCES